MKRPREEEIPEILDLPEIPYKEYYYEPEWEDGLRKGTRGLPPHVEERRRSLLASQLGATKGVARLPDSRQIVFSCPVCHERTQCDDTELGKERVCPTCRSEYKLPEQVGDSQILVLRVDARRGQHEELPALILPEERGFDGRSNEALFQSVEELMQEGQEDVVVEWGLEKYEAKPEPAKFRRLWASVALLLFLLAAGFLVHHVHQSSGRTGAGDPLPGSDVSIRNPTDGGLDWANIPANRVFQMADSTIRTYFSAPDVAAKAAVSRGGGSALARMQAHYEAKGGYEAETRAHGDVRSITFLEERELGGQKFLVVRVRFENGDSGILVLLKAKEKLEVDWDYAVAYGELDFENLLDERPVRPVLLRAYLRKGRDFSDGFTSTEFRNFNLRDPARSFSIPVYVAIGSAAETKLLEAWSEGKNAALGKGRGDARELHFTVKVRFDNSGGRRGFVLDEVLAQGWILPDSPL